MFINNLDPIAFEFFSLQIRWYSLAYIFGFLIGWFYIKNFLTKDMQEKALIDDFISYLILGVIIGGRLGYVIFYNFLYYLNHPVEIFFVWQGGMSFHGGLLGVCLATYIYVKKYNLNFLRFSDFVSVVAPIGIFLGRLANFINSELYGKETDFIFSVNFNKIDNLYRHPSQLYESFFEGIVLFAILNLIWKKFSDIPGVVSALFLICYSFFRFLIEFTREPDAHLGIVLNIFTYGQILSIIFFISGVIILKVIKK
tara:strand:- start:89 stop:853 length:765 start_codon:yes stop_codon:yes gene_type:complete